MTTFVDLSRLSPVPVEAKAKLAQAFSGLAQGVGLSPRALLARYRQILVGADLVAALVAAMIGMVLRFGGSPRPEYVALSVLTPFLWTAAVAAQGGYESRFLGTGPDEYRRLGDATLLLFAITAATSFVIKSDLSRGYVMLTLPLVAFGSVLLRRGLRYWLFHRRRCGDGLHRVLVVGRDDSAAHLIEQLEREPWHGLAPIGACIPGVREDPGADGRVQGSGPRSDHVDEITAMVLRTGASVVAVAPHPDLSGHALRRLAWAMEEHGVELIVSPGILEVAGPRLSIRPVAGLSLLHLDWPGRRRGRILVKNVLDRSSALALLLLSLPLIIAVAAAIRLTSRGPIIFRQTRVGLGGRQFQMLKFRSMVIDAEARLAELQNSNDMDGLLFKMRDDPRITRVGGALRRFSLDEMPQLWNVVRGEMSLVGPRPPLPREVEAYDSDARRRLRVRPGLTGLWQVSGRSDLTWEESLRLDLRYVDNWSLWLDLAILWRTWRAVIGRSGAY